MRKHGRSFLMMVTNLSSATTGVCASRKSLGTCDRSRLSKRLPTLELRVLEENDCFAIPNFSAIHHFPSLIQAELYHFDFFTFRRGSAAIGRSTFRIVMRDKKVQPLRYGPGLINASKI
jgi:hypothetical protein